jgi:hypothetical protein
MKASHFRKPVLLSESTKHRLGAYALGASAAGVTGLALTFPAEAKIIYTPTHVKISHTIDLDLNHDGTTDFTIFSTGIGGTTHSLAINGPNGDYFNKVEVLVTRHYGRFATALDTGMGIGQGHSFYRHAPLVQVFGRSNQTSLVLGPWANVRNRYLGLKFKIGSHAHYGWARLNVKIGPLKEITTVLTGYAYETTPNKQITAGQTHGPDVIILPADTRAGTLEHLALGRQ